jgi:TRAP-type C4-dicarboxylate transport system substrate-binding protein
MTKNVIPRQWRECMSKKSESSPTTRRKFLGGAAMATAATVAAPSVVSAQGPVSMRWQSTWPSKDIFHEYALDYAKKVNDMTGGDLKIEVLPAGAVVPAFGLLDAVSKGTLDGGHGVLVYHYGKQTALALWGSGPAFAMDANMLLAWHKYGGGKELLAKLYASIGANVVSFPYGPMPTQPLGWFKRPITKVDDLKGLKFRTVGISIDVFQGLGSAVNALPGGEIVSALDRGLLDAAEFNNASSDRALGFADVSKVCMLQSYHQVRCLARKDEGDHRQCGRGRVAGHVAESDRPLLQGLRRAADQGQRQVLQDAGCDTEAAARDLRRGREEKGRRESAVQRNSRLPARICQACHAVGAGHGGEPPHGVRSLLGRQRGREEDLTSH